MQSGGAMGETPRNKGTFVKISVWTLQKTQLAGQKSSWNNGFNKTDQLVLFSLQEDNQVKF